MQELITQSKQLPETIEEKAKYVLFGTDVLKAYRAKLSIMKKSGITSEQYEQLKLEAQETAENLLLFSVDIGKEIQKIDKASGGDRRSENFKNDVNDNFEKSKKETIHEMGFTDRQARDFQTLAKHPDYVDEAIEEARTDGKIVTRQDVFDKIAAETESRKQKEARELREAKRRAAEFEEAKVMTIESVKQNKEDRRQIYEEFEYGFENMVNRVRQVAIMAETGELEKAVRMAEKREQEKLSDNLMDLYRMVLKIQKKVMEVIDEK